MHFVARVSPETKKPAYIVGPLVLKSTTYSTEISSSTGDTIFVTGLHYVDSATSHPSGQISHATAYYNTSENKIFVYDSTKKAWVSMASTVSIPGGICAPIAPTYDFPALYSTPKAVREHYAKAA